jgi:hypothetical protein
MSDTTPQTADGKVLFHFAMSLDGFVAGPDNEMGWMAGVSVRPGPHDEYIATTGAILGGRKAGTRPSTAAARTAAPGRGRSSGMLPFRGADSGGRSAP